MTKVSYEVRKDGFKGCITVNTFAEAIRKAQQIGGYFKTVYTEMADEPLSKRDIELREKRMAHFGIV